MRVLIVKSYKYGYLKTDPLFTLEVAFRRLKGVVEIAREVEPGAPLSVIVPDCEFAEARRQVQVGENGAIYPTGKTGSLDGFLNASSPVLVLDEQGFYSSPDLIRKVMEEAGSSEGCTWKDSEFLLWSFDHHDSCRFFVASAPLIAKHLRRCPGHSSLETAVFGDALTVRHYTLLPSDIPAIYGRAARFNPYPYDFYVEPTSRCNSKCVMCPFHSSDSEIAKGRLYLGTGGDNMPYEMFTRTVDEIASIGWSYLPHYRPPKSLPKSGASRLSRPISGKCANYAKNHDMKLSFSTNGSVLHKNNLMEFLLEIGTDEIIISIDGDAEEYARIRPQLDYQQVVDNIRELRRLRDKKGSGLPKIYTKRVRLRNSNAEADRKYVDFFSRIVDSTGIAFENYDDFKTEGKGFSDYFFDVAPEKRLPCIWASDVTLVKANGGVDMCFGAAEHYIGNVLESSLCEILRSSSLKNDIMQSHIRGNFTSVSFCAPCSSWKHNYHRFYEIDGYSVKENPVLAYWSKNASGSDNGGATSRKASVLERLLHKVGIGT